MPCKVMRNPGIGDGAGVFLCGKARRERTGYGQGQEGKRRDASGDIAQAVFAFGAEGTNSAKSAQQDGGGQYCPKGVDVLPVHIAALSPLNSRSRFICAMIR